jgi:hypothetical protein
MVGEIKIKEAKNGAAQLSQGKYFLMTNKFTIKRGANRGKGLVAVKVSELTDKKDTPFTIIKSFLLSEKEFDAWLALLVQISNRKPAVLENAT